MCLGVLPKFHWDLFVHVCMEAVYLGSPQVVVLAVSAEKEGYMKMHKPIAQIRRKFIPTPNSLLCHSRMFS